MRITRSTIPFRAMRRDELLAQAIAAHQRRLVSAHEDKPVVTSQRERIRHPSKRAEPGDQSMLQCARSRAGLTAARQVPAWQFPRVESITNASVAQPSRPAQTRHISVDLRSYCSFTSCGFAHSAFSMCQHTLALGRPSLCSSSFRPLWCEQEIAGSLHFSDRAARFGL